MIFQSSSVLLRISVNVARFSIGTLFLVSAGCWHRAIITGLILLSQVAVGRFDITKQIFGFSEVEVYLARMLLISLANGLTISN
jgi:hypothetical protein